jgi:hypothetical protein
MRMVVEQEVDEVDFLLTKHEASRICVAVRIPSKSASLGCLAMQMFHMVKRKDIPKIILLFEPRKDSANVHSSTLA